MFPVEKACLMVANVEAAVAPGATKEVCGP